MISVLDVMASVVKTDQDSIEGFGDDLRRSVEQLENVRENLKDWHPGSDGLVLDLVHPSVFPLEYGTTRILPIGHVQRDNCAAYIGMGEVCPALPPNMKTSVGSDRVGQIEYGSYQWLPTDVSFDEHNSASIDGFINNLHPTHHTTL